MFQCKLNLWSVLCANEADKVFLIITFPRWNNPENPWKIETILLCRHCTLCILCSMHITKVWLFKFICVTHRKGDFFCRWLLCVYASLCPSRTPGFSKSIVTQRYYLAKIVTVLCRVGQKEWLLGFKNGEKMDDVEPRITKHFCLKSVNIWLSRRGVYNTTDMSSGYHVKLNFAPHYFVGNFSLISS